MSELSLDRVTKVYQDDDEEIVAVDDISVDIEDEEFLVLVGPSGCGKSTTLRMIAGLETITEGEIRLGGTVINDMDTQDRDIAMVFQSYALYPHLTARGNMSFGLEESTDLPDDDIEERVEEVASMMGIDDLLDRKPGELSGGQQQRIALGRAIVRDPELFLMDEPLSNLDAKLRAEMRTELQQLQRQLGVTTIYVTHDQTEAMTMSDRIAVMDQGELQQVGEPLELYHDPNNMFVAGFIGEPSMNFFHGKYNDGSFVGDLFEYPVSREIDDAVAGTSELVLGIRPEEIEILNDADIGDDPAHEYEMHVTVVEPMGDQNVVHLSRPGTDDMSDNLVAVTEGLRDVTEDSTTTVRIPSDAVHFFDGGSGVSLHNRQLDLTEETLRL
ncbi:ABC transporter ATP-binding protein [Haloarcula mannanilytica]|uniref:ABC-type D-xylose/L-arabinose transporter n=1 Tax=Haloarcula mannanilytica TaxID=2509225 RepID=A0A4C2EJL8_9EURY|nr:ABC transporter ATP-binding protein [Haloarcula mannanilytica]GCF14688.1 ABC transporter ATP-binding protein [Haloarcula mannanilytica]